MSDRTKRALIRFGKVLIAAYLAQLALIPAEALTLQGAIAAFSTALLVAADKYLRDK